MGDAAAGGELDRGGPGVGGVAAGSGEAGRVAAVADEHAGDDRADPEDLAQRRTAAVSNRVTVTKFSDIAARASSTANFKASNVVFAPS